MNIQKKYLDVEMTSPVLLRPSLLLMPAPKRIIIQLLSWENGNQNNILCLQKREHLEYQLSVNTSMSETLASEVTATPDEYQRNITLFIETHLGKVDRFPQFRHRYFLNLNPSNPSTAFWYRPLKCFIASLFTVVFSWVNSPADHLANVSRSIAFLKELYCSINVKIEEL